MEFLDISDFEQWNLNVQSPFYINGHCYYKYSYINIIFFDSYQTHLTCFESYIPEFLMGLISEFTSLKR